MQNMISLAYQATRASKVAWGDYGVCPFVCIVIMIQNFLSPVPRASRNNTLSDPAYPIIKLRMSTAASVGQNNTYMHTLYILDAV